MTNGEAKRSSNVKGYYKGYPIQLTLRDPKEKVYPLLKKMIKVVDWMQENDFKPSWNEQTNKELETNDDIAENVFCPVHKVKLKHYVRGQDEWWSHKLPSGEWCNGRDTKYNRKK